jgi:hypothetical protein
VAGVSEQLRFAYQGGIKMIAACSERPFDLQKASQEPPPKMMHIWEMPQWNSLYDAMYGSSENDWYERLGKSIAEERQELLVNLRIAYGTKSPVLSKEPVYLYEELRLKGARVSLPMLRALGLFSREVAEKGWSWRWCSTQVTAEPQLLCQLWSASSEQVIHQGLAELASSDCYQELMSHTETLTRRIMYPTFVETLAAKWAASTHADT